MDKGRCGSSEAWDILSGISLDDVIILFYHWNYLQVVLCAVAYY